jgi:hypothetical protein
MYTIVVVYLNVHMCVTILHAGHTSSTGNGMHYHIMVPYITCTCVWTTLQVISHLLSCMYSIPSILPAGNMSFLAYVIQYSCICTLHIFLTLCLQASTITSIHKPIMAVHLTVNPCITIRRLLAYISFHSCIFNHDYLFLTMFAGHLYSRISNQWFVYLTMYMHGCIITTCINPDIVWRVACGPLVYGI